MEFRTKMKQYNVNKQKNCCVISSGTTRLSGSKKDSGSTTNMKDKDREKGLNSKFSDDEEDNKSNWDDEDDEEKPHENEDEEEDEATKKKKDDKRKKDKKERENPVTEDEEDKDEEMKEVDEEKIQNEEDENDEEENENDEKGEKGRNTGTEELPSRRDGKRFIKLNCPHCDHRSVTFKEYSLHLYSRRHSAAMRQIASENKVILTRMRVSQRQEQRRVEARDAARGTLPSRTIFCPICKLNYRSLKAVHQLSESHRRMKRFLTPFCRVCRIQFRSPMLFKTHMCSLDHIKRKSILEEKMKTENGETEAESSAPEEDDKEVNLDNFMTLDSVGDVDEEDGDSNEKTKEDKVDGESPTELEKKPKTKTMIKVGAEYIKRVEVQYCELCKVYLPRNENNERAVALHCSTRSHLKRYVRDNDDKALRRQAERIHLNTQSTSSSNNTNSHTNVTTLSENAKDSSMNSEQAGEAIITKDTETTDLKPDIKKESNETDVNAQIVEIHPADDEDEDQDKMWDDVDKDLGDILRETEPGGKSSDDEDSRYDRFRNSDKNKQNQQQQPSHENEKEQRANNEKLDEENHTKKQDTVKVKVDKIDK